MRFLGQDWSMSLLNEGFCAQGVMADVRYLDTDVDGHSSICVTAVADTHCGKSAAPPIGTPDAKSGEQQVKPEAA